MIAKKLIIYLAIPAGVSLALVAAYFSGVAWLQEIISPRMPQMHPNAGREFGLLEGLQNLCLLAMIGVAAYGAWHKERNLERTAFALIAAFALFVLLEEIDYGLHYYEFLCGVPPWEAATVRNIHNMGDTTDLIKRPVDAGMAVLFVLLPIFGARSAKPLVRYLAPDRFAIATVVTMVAVSSLAHALKDAGVGGHGTISKNISEFRELLVYYLFMVYLIDLAFHRTFPVAEPTSEGAEGPSSRAAPRWLTWAGPRRYPTRRSKREGVGSQGTSSLKRSSTGQYTKDTIDKGLQPLAKESGVMNKGLVAVIVVAALVVVGLPLLAQLAKDKDGAGDAAEPAAAQSAPQPAAPRPAPPRRPIQPGPARPSQAAGPQLNAQNLAGSMWEYEGHKFEFKAGGQAQVYMPGMQPGPNVQGIPAQWSVSGSTLNVSAMGENIQAQISGNQIMGPNGPIRRVR